MVGCTVTRLLEEVTKETDESEGVVEDADIGEVSVDEFGRRVVSQCFEVPFSILDVNECAAKEGHAWKHACPPLSVCVNTVGSYECLCKSFHRRTYEELISGYQFAADDQFWTDVDAERRSAWEKLLPGASDEGVSTCPGGSVIAKGCCNGDASGA